MKVKWVEVMRLLLLILDYYYKLPQTKSTRNSSLFWPVIIWRSEAQLWIHSLWWLRCEVNWIYVPSEMSSHYVCMVWREMCSVGMRTSRRLPITSWHWLYNGYFWNTQASCADSDQLVNILYLDTSLLIYTDDLLMGAVSSCVSAGMGKLFGWSGNKYMQSLILSISLSNKKKKHKFCYIYYSVRTSTQCQTYMCNIVQFSE